ncbi:MAG: RecX family transcriptional regulator [Gaiellaceae bacterium]
MPRVTGLLERRGGRVAVEVDGEPWRTLPVDAAVRAELRIGVELDRPRLRLVRRELRRAEALAWAVRALRRRDYSARALDRRLEQAGLRSHERRAALDTLERAGLLDDERFALARAESLAERGFGNEAIRWQLEREGVDPDLVGRAVLSLPPERERATEVAARRGAGRATAAFLARRGFAEESVESALGGAGGDE